MSKTIDEKVIEMRFDNKQFESGVKTTMSSLDKLKQSLNFQGVVKGFDNISSAAKTVNMSPLSSGVEAVRVKFSALEVMAVTALSNIANSAFNVGRRIAESLTIQPITTGFNEYELKMNSVQTIMAGTGESLATVNGYLDDLNKYSDQTIYSFSDMTSNIGKFTNAGVKLDTAVLAMKGISNEAALSGANANEAARAMYNLSQAISMGYVQLIDWKSIENANMATAEFKNELLKTAVAAGTVKTAGNGLYNAGKKNLNMQAMFKDGLTDQWLTTEVLLGTLSKYADETTDLGKRAYAAAQDVKTLTQMSGVLKEAAQSGWAQTWETIVGDFNEAKSLFTYLSNTFGDLIGKSADARNAFLKDSLDSNWEKLTAKISEAGVSVEDFESKIKEVATKHRIDVGLLIAEYGSLSEATKAGKVSTIVIEEAVKSLTGSLVDLSEIKDNLEKGSKGDQVKTAQQALKNLGYDLGKFGEKLDGIDGVFGKVTESAVRAFQKSKGLTETGILGPETLKALEDTSGKIDDIYDLIDGVNKFGGRDLLVKSLENIVNAIKQVSETVGKAWGEIFDPIKPESVQKIIKTLHDFTANLTMSEDTVDKLKRSFKGLFAIIDIVRTFTGGALKTAFKLLAKVLGAVDGGILSITASVGDAVVAFRDWLFNNNLITKAIETLVSWCKTGYSTIKGWIEYIAKLPIVNQALTTVVNGCVLLYQKLKSFFVGGKEVIDAFIERVKKVQFLTFDDVKAVFEDFATNVLGYFGKIGESFKAFGMLLGNGWASIKNGLKMVGIDLDVLKDQIFGFFDAVVGKIKSVTFKDLISAAIGVGLVVLIASIKNLVDALIGPLEALKNLIGSLISIFKAKALGEKATALIKFAGAVLILAAAVKLLSTIPKEDLWASVGALGALAGGLVLVATAISLLSKLGGFEKGSISLLAIAGALRLVISSLLEMENLNPEKLNKNLWILAGMAVGMGTIAAVLGKLAPELSSGSFVFVAFAVSLKILVSALADMEELDPYKIRRSIKALLLGTAGLSVMALAAQNVKFGSGLAIIGMVAALKLLVSVFDDISGIDMAKIENNIGAFKAVFTGLIALIIASNFVGRNALGFGIMVVGISTSLLIVAEAIKKLGNIDSQTLQQSEYVLTELMKVFALVVAASMFAGKYAKRAGTMLVLMSASLLILTVVIDRLTNIKDVNGLNRATEAITGIMKCFALLIASTWFSEKAKGTVIALLAATVVLCGALYLLANKANPEGLDSARNAMSMVIGMFALLVVSTKLVGKASGTLIVMTVVVGALGYILYKLSSLPTDSALKAAEALSLLLVAISASMFIMSKIPIIGAVKGVAGLAIFVGGLSLILTALGAINKGIPSFSEFMDKGIPILGKIGTAIGTFIGNLVGSFTGGLSSGLNAFADNLNTFIDDFKKFVWKAQSIDEDSLSSVKRLAEMVLILTGADLVNRIASWIPGRPSLTSFAEDLKAFGEGLVPFAESVSSLDDGALKGVKAAADAGLVIAKMAKELPNEGGILGGIVGENSMGLIGPQLENFAVAICSFSNMAGMFPVDLTAVQNTCDAASLIATMASKLPNQGGWLGAIVGENNMDVVGPQLENFAVAICDFSNMAAMFPVDLTAVRNACDAATLISVMAEGLPNQGGIFGGIVGDNNMDKIGPQLENFAVAICSFSNMVTMFPIDLGAVQNACDAATLISIMANSLPNQGGFISGIVGDNNLDRLGPQLENFAVGICSFANMVTMFPVNVANVQNACDAAVLIAKMANEIPNEGGFVGRIVGDNTLADFGTQLENFGYAIAAFSKSVSETVDVGSCEDAIKVATEVIGFANTYSSSPMAINPFLLKLFGADLTWLGFYAKEFYDHIASIDSTKVSSVIGKISEIIDVSGTTNADVKSFGENLASLGETGVTKFTDSFSTEVSIGKIKSAAAKMMEKLISSIEEAYSDFTAAGKYLVQGFADGIANNVYLASSAAKEMARKAAEAAAKELDERSPSKVGYQIGDYFGVAFVNALKDYSDKAYSAGAGMADSAKTGLAKTIASISDSIANSVDAQPRIRPVLDLSDVKAGAATINRIAGGWGGYRLGGTVDLAQSASVQMMNRQNAIDLKAEQLNGVGGKSISAPTTITNTFHITGDNPRAIADEVSRAFQHQYERINAVWDQ